MMGSGDFPKLRQSHQWNNHSATIIVELGGLHHDDERDGVLVFPFIAVDVELRHQSDEYSSAMEPEMELKSFHEATVASTTFDF